MLFGFGHELNYAVFSSSSGSPRRQFKRSPAAPNLPSEAHAAPSTSFRKNNAEPSLPSRIPPTPSSLDFHCISVDSQGVETIGKLLIPHKGSLRRLSMPQKNQHGIGIDPSSITDPQHKPPSALYSIELSSSSSSREQHETRPSSASLSRLVFTKSQLDAMQRLFLVLDTESRSYLTYVQVEEFIHTRCPVVRRRDHAIIWLQQQRNQGQSKKKEDDCQMAYNKSCTLLEAWRTIVHTGTSPESISSMMEQYPSSHDVFYTKHAALGLEGWMILLRLVSFCQYQEAKQFFSAKRLGNNAIMVDVPRLPPVVPLTMEDLLQYEMKFDYRRLFSSGAKISSYGFTNTPLQYCPPMPELDLNHSGISAHEETKVVDVGLICNPSFGGCSTISILPPSHVSVEAMGSCSEAFWNTGKVDLLLTLTTTKASSENMSGHRSFSLMSTTVECITTTSTVRRSLEDLLWLHDTFMAHKKPGGTLCGRILPPLLSEDMLDVRRESLRNTSQHRDMSESGLWSYCKSVGKSFVGTIKRNTGRNLSSSSKSSGRVLERDAVTISQELRLKRIERYLNYLLGHSGLKSSFPLNSMLKASKTGLEAAKRILDEMKSSSSTAETSDKSQLDHRASTNIYPSSHSIAGYVTLNNLDWVRTAAQAAMAFQVHGILNATGMSTYSAKLQHASLPELDYHQRYRGDTQSLHTAYGTDLHSVGNDWESTPQVDDGNPHDAFERGVTSVECTLDDEYDMLPAPSKERGSLYDAAAPSTSPDGLANGLFSDASVVDATIDKLRDTIGAVDEHLNKCFAAYQQVAAAAAARADIHLNIVHALDTHCYDGGERCSGFLTIDEQCFLGGITYIERCLEAMSKSDLDTCEGEKMPYRHPVPFQYTLTVQLQHAFSDSF